MSRTTLQRRCGDRLTVVMGQYIRAAYLLGGMQLYALHHELVDSGKLSNRAFHDWILKENRIPIEMVRAILTKQKLTRDFQTS